MKEDVKVVINFGVDLEDVPSTVADLLKSLSERSTGKINFLFDGSIRDCQNKEIQSALESVDELRQLLSKIDMRLMDSLSILAGYAKTKANILEGIDPSAQPEEETNDQASASDSSEPEE